MLNLNYRRLLPLHLHCLYRKNVRILLANQKLPNKWKKNRDLYIRRSWIWVPLMRKMIGKIKLSWCFVEFLKCKKCQNNIRKKSASEEWIAE